MSPSVEPPTYEAIARLAEDWAALEGRNWWVVASGATDPRTWRTCRQGETLGPDEIVVAVKVPHPADSPVPEWALPNPADDVRVPVVFVVRVWERSGGCDPVRLVRHARLPIAPQRGLRIRGLINGPCDAEVTRVSVDLATGTVEAEVRTGFVSAESIEWALATLGPGWDLPLADDRQKEVA